MFTRILSKFPKAKFTPDGESIDMDVLQQGLDEIKRKEDQAGEILDVLDIPWSNGSSAQPLVRATDLVKILTDEKKLKVIVSKLRNKAFW